MKMAVIYHSASGHTKEMAEVIAEGMQAAGGDAKSFSIDNIDEDWVKESKCVVIGTPIYLASLSGKMKSWLPTSFMSSVSPVKSAALSPRPTMSTAAANSAYAPFWII